MLSHRGTTIHLQRKSVRVFLFPRDGLLVDDFLKLLKCLLFFGILVNDMPEFDS